MTKKMINLMKINFLCYVSFFLYTYISFNNEIENWLLVFGFAPYIFVFSSFYILFNNTKKYFRIIKIEAIIDLLIRVIALILNFSLYTHEVYSFWFNSTITFLIILFLTNIYLEKLMYKKVVAFSDIELPDNDVVIPQDQTNFNNLINMQKAVNKSLKDFPLIFIMIILINSLKKINYNQMKIVTILVCVLLLMFFLRSSYKSLALYYNDIITIKQKFFKESKFIFYGIIIGISYQLLNIESAAIDFFIICLQAICIYPVIKARQLRAKNLYAIKNN